MLTSLRTSADLESGIVSARYSGIRHFRGFAMASGPHEHLPTRDGCQVSLVSMQSHSRHDSLSCRSSRTRNRCQKVDTHLVALELTEARRSPAWSQASHSEPRTLPSRAPGRGPARRDSPVTTPKNGDPPGATAGQPLSRLETSSAGVAVAPRLVQPFGVGARIFAAGDVNGPKTRRATSGLRLG
jgi:hypothetical protein